MFTNVVISFQNLLPKVRADAQNNIPKDVIPDESPATIGYAETRSSPEKKSTRSSSTSDSSSGSSSSSEAFK